ncbi:YbaB/EbfC family nucleoid-associated protein [Streptosporangium sp. KLBMP 9127]|nr:YbaB/EbfC family nucleoid-associated protein [Streptosporangium sp. KLBMP 9127]
MQEDREYLDHLLTQAEDVVRGLRAAHARLGQVTGRGEGADGLVRAVSDGHGKLRELLIAPRGMRLDFAVLALEVGRAIQAAQRDAERQAQAIMSEVDAKTAKLPKALDASFVQERIEQVSREIDVHLGADLPG